MPINEIEIQGTSFGVQVFKIKDANMNRTFLEMTAPENQFNPKEEKHGFFDLDSSGDIYTGSFGQVVAFEIECLEEGMMVTKLLKKIALVNFWAAQDLLFVQGPASVTNALRVQLASFGYLPVPLDFSTRQLQDFSERLSRVSSVSFQNPKTESIRKGKISGSVEGWESFSGVSQDHMIESVSGTWSFPEVGPMKVTITGKGKITMGVKKGSIITVDILVHLVRLVLDTPDLTNGHFARANEIGKDLNNFLKKEGCSMTMTVDNETVTIGAPVKEENNGSV